MAVEAQAGNPSARPVDGGPRSPARAAAEEWELEAKAPPSAPPSPGLPPKGKGGGGGYPQKNAEILSSQYGLHLFLAGLVLMFAWAVHAEGLAKSAVLAYLVTLMLLQILWMAWYVCRRKAQKRLVQDDKDGHAGTRWLKCEWIDQSRAAGGLGRGWPFHQWVREFAWGGGPCPEELTICYLTQGDHPAQGVGKLVQGRGKLVSSRSTGIHNCQALPHSLPKTSWNGRDAP